MRAIAVSDNQICHRYQAHLFEEKYLLLTLVGWPCKPNVNDKMLTVRCKLKNRMIAIVVSHNQICHRSKQPFRGNLLFPVPVRWPFKSDVNHQMSTVRCKPKNLRKAIALSYYQVCHRYQSKLFEEITCFWRQFVDPANLMLTRRCQPSYLNCRIR